MLTKYVFAVASGACQNIPFFVATHWKFEFPLQDASREMKVGIGWDPTLFTYDPGGDSARIGGGVSKLPSQTKTFCHNASV